MSAAPSIKDLHWDIHPVDHQHQSWIEQHIANKIKPPGALGQLEQLACTMALIANTHHSATKGTNTPLTQLPKIKACALIFAGDHGIAKHPISIAPQAVTAQMVSHFLQGGAAINCFCRNLAIPLHVIDTGIATPISADIKLGDTIASQQIQFFPQRLGAQTQDLSTCAAMTEQQTLDGLELGKRAAMRCIQQGHNTLALGEMGIGNTSSASAILAALLGLTAEQTCGRGTGISDEQLALKCQLLNQGLARVNTEEIKPLLVLQQLGGFEIAQLVGAILAIAESKKIAIIDGFIVSVAALLAARIVPACRDYMLFAHASAEQAHQRVLETLNARPLLNLDLRLGEGTGAVLALPLLDAAVSFFNHMATLDTVSVNLD